MGMYYEYSIHMFGYFTNPLIHKHLKNKWNNI